MPEKPASSPKERKQNRYAAIIGDIFERHYKNGLIEFEFTRAEFEEVAKKLDIVLPKNLGNILYSFRFRAVLPPEIVATAGDDLEWIIELAGRGRYRFRLAKLAIIVPNPNMLAIKIPDATPELIAMYALTDEQAVLAKVRYNRLMGVNRHGEQSILPVQAKSGNDRVSVVHTTQDVTWCRERFPLLACRSVSAQFMSDDVIALFELALDGQDVKIVEEKHYKLVPGDQILEADLQLYAKR